MSFELRQEPRTHPLDPDCILFDPDSKPPGLQLLVTSWEESKLRREVQHHMKIARSSTLSILLIRSWRF